MYPPYCPINGNAMRASPQPERTLNETQARVSLSCLHTRLDQLKDDFRFPPRVELIFGSGNVIINVPTGPAILDGLARMPMDTNHIGFAEPSNLNYPLYDHLRQLRDILVRLRGVKHACMNKMSIADVQTAVEREIQRVERWKDMVRVAGAAWMLEQAACINAADVEGARTPSPSFNDGPTPLYPYPIPPPMPPTRPLTACSDSSKSSHFVPQSQGIVPPAPMPFFPPSPGRIPALTYWGWPQSSVWGGINARSKRRELPPLSPSQARDALEYVHAQLAILKTQFFFPSIVDIRIGSSTMAFSVPTVPNPTALDVLAQLPLDNSRISFPKDTSNNGTFQSHLEQLDEVLSTVHGIKCIKPDAVAEHRSRVEDAVSEEIELIERWKRMVRVAAAAWLVEQTAGIKESVS
ncbi:hypothetical protein EWM64_g4322 [Hericium alpestre]|uniref:Uncharacterized protein n=1 Tax=Hericium alpestre TaxID=135208 RepID=A0A4Y9ZZU6_9AGAM|nr:hypothetical protein EWM64_g4322 [Hericium alpestre]